LHDQFSFGSRPYLHKVSNCSFVGICQPFPSIFRLAVHFRVPPHNKALSGPWNHSRLVSVSYRIPFSYKMNDFFFDTTPGTVSSELTAATVAVFSTGEDTDSLEDAAAVFVFSVLTFFFTQFRQPGKHTVGELLQVGGKAVGIFRILDGFPEKDFIGTIGCGSGCIGRLDRT